MKKSVKSIVVLVSICAVVSVLLALTNYITEPIIKATEQQNANAALLELLPDGGSFELVDTSGYTLPSSVQEVYRASNGGYVVKLTVAGYNPGMVIMCGISAEGTVIGTKLLSSEETPSIGGKALESFAPALVGADVSTVGNIDTVSGATKTTTAYRAAVTDALNTALILGGAEVDLRTEEEKFNDALTEALPASEGKFTKVFLCELTEGVDKIYSADNGAGHVCIIGDTLVGVDAEGNAVSSCTEAEAQAAVAAVTLIKATVTTDIDIAAFEGLPKQLISAKRTASGNYIIEIKGVGYGIKGGNEYHPASGEYIIIRVSITADGRIIDCFTVSEAESKGIGDACALESFYSQFVGKTEQNYSDIDAITGATITTDGYKEAVLRAFECVKIFEGGDK